MNPENPGADLVKKATKRQLIDKIRDLQDTLGFSELTPEGQLEIFKELNNIQLKVLADKPQETAKDTKGNRY